MQRYTNKKRYRQKKLNNSKFVKNKKSTPDWPIDGRVSDFDESNVNGRKKKNVFCYLVFKKVTN